jgi:hypothetical protein
MRALAMSYFQSPDFHSMQSRTQRIYRNIIERLCEQKDKLGNPIGNNPQP